MSDHRPEASAGDLLDRLITQAEQETSSSSADAIPSEVIGRSAGPSSSAERSQDSPLGGILGNLLSNPALLSALPQLLGVLSGTKSASAGEKRPDSVEASAAGKAVSPEKAPTAAFPARHLPPDRHTALLCALKPYLGSERRQAVEYLINVCRVWGTLQSVGLTLPALLSAEQGKDAPSGDKEV